MHSKLYISGTGAVSPQPTAEPSQFPAVIRNTGDVSLRCLEPNYREFIAGDQVRRMSRHIKMGVAAARMALAAAGTTGMTPAQPDAIITGTGLGCIEDTEKFLAAMIRNNEEFLTPTSFIQSTHNTVSAQIALLLKCHGYNFTYVHRGFSFESALLDAMIRAAQAPESKILLGASDELTTHTLQILQRLGQVRQKPVNNLSLLDENRRGSLPGEGATFFLVSGVPGERPLAAITGLRTLFRPASEDEITSAAAGLLDECRLSPGMIDLLVTGLNGDHHDDPAYRAFISSMPSSTGIAAFKPLCGEYFTATAFATWLSAKMIHDRYFPEPVMIRKPTATVISNILIHNHFKNIGHSFILLTKT